MQSVRRGPGIIDAKPGKVEKDHAHVQGIDRRKGDISVGGGGGDGKSTGVDIVGADGESCGFG